MKKISDALRSLVDQNSFLKFGLHHRLLNLSQVARHLKPQLQARLQKEIDESAVTMNLSRLQREVSQVPPSGNESLHISNVVVHSNLCVLAFPKTKGTHSGMNKLYNRVQKENGYITISEGISEVSIITDHKYLPYAQEYFDTKPLSEYQNIASLGVKFEPEYLRSVGLFYRVFQQFAYQRINIVEIASASSELIIYLEEKDVKLAFDTLFQRMREERGA